MAKRRGRKSAAQTPAPPKERIYGSKKNPKGSASSESTAKGITLSAKIIETLKNKLAEFKKKHPNKKNVTLNDLKAVFRRGAGAYSKSHRPTITGGVPNSRNAWAFARVNKFLKKAGGEKVKEAYVQDDDLLKMEGGGATLLAPNGKPSNLTTEQWKLVRTPEFKNWFGDWENDPENASKVVDENGEPLVVYHGTIKKFTTFDKSEVGSRFGFDKVGFFFTDSLTIATNYAYEKGQKWYVLPVFLSIKSPLNVNVTGRNNPIYEWDVNEGKFITKLKEEDGIILHPKNLEYFEKSGEDLFTLFVALEPSQIKLSDGTNITFDPNNPDIRYAKGGEVEKLISDGIVEIKMFDTSNEHSKLYGFDATNPLYIQSIIVSKEHRGKGIGGKVFKYILDYAKENKNDLIFGHITQKAEPSIDVIKSMLNKAGFKTIDGNNDFYKIINTKYAKGGATLLAPNGHPSNLTAEQYKLVRTPEFKAWFGDWENDPENASKVVDENGEPLVVYHGSNKRFTKFKDSQYDNYIFFTNDKSHSELYGDYSYECFMSVKNPSKELFPKQTLFENGMDGFINHYGDDDFFEEKTRVYCAIKSNQIKLADGSNTTFDTKKRDIRYAEGGLIAPNGKKSNLTAEQYKLVRTPEFKAWFGDWEKDPENASKVVDDNGEPLVVYHGTRSKKKINVFKHGIEKRTDEGFHGGNLFYFTPRKTYAEGYAYRDTGTSGKIYECFLNVRNPKKTTDTKSIKPPYNDGTMVFYKHPDRGTHYGNLFEIAVENSNQIKLADGTNITFDPTNPDIRYAKGGLTGGYEDLNDEWLSKKIEIFLDKVKPIKYYFVDPNTNTLIVGFDKHYSTDSAEKFYKEAISSAEFFDADSVESTYDSKTGDTTFRIKLKKSVEYKKGGKMKDMIALPDVYSSFEPLKRVLNMQGYDLTKTYKEGGEMKTKNLEQAIDTIGNVDSDPIVEGVMAKGGMLSDEKKEVYEKWKDLINMSKSELEKFYNSEEGKEAGITIETAKKLGISRGRTSAKWIMKMKDTSVSDWTPEMWKWANKQISFVSRMRGNKGELYDEKGRKTRKHTSLLIWGHNPEKYANGGQTNRVSLEGYYKKGGEAKTCEIIRNGVRQIDPKSIEKLTDCVMSLPQTKLLHTDKEGNYTPERRELHRKIIFDIKKDLTCVERSQPIAILMGGSPASGKSTFLKKYRPYLLSEEILKIDADEIRAKLPEYKGYNAAQTHLETKDIVNTLLSDRNIGIPCRFDVVYDGTMNSTKSYIPLINLLKSLGYKVFIVYIDKVEKDVIVKRALERYKKSGRFVPLEVIDDFFEKGTGALENLKSMVDGYMVVDGSSSDYKVIERGGNQLPKDRNYSKIGTPIQVTEDEVVREFKKGGQTDFNPDAKNLKNMITHKSGGVGGMLVGKRHSEGGIKAINKSTGQPLEMEGGEVVITRDAVSDETKREFEGQMLTNREILSKINESGGGVSFADGGDTGECGCTGKKFNYGGKTMTDFDIVKEMKSAYPRDFAKGRKEELSEHKSTFEKLRRKGLTASQAADIVVAEHLKKKPDYYKNYEKGGVIDMLGKKVPSMPTFLKVGERVMTPFKGLITYFYPVKDSRGGNSYREGGHIRGRKISDLLAYKTYIYDNFGINFSDLPVKLQNALTLGSQKLVDDYLKE